VCWTRDEAAAQWGAMRLPLLVCLLFAAACASGGKQQRDDSRSRAESSSTGEGGVTAEQEGVFIARGTDEVSDTRPVPKMTAEEVREFNRIWELFRRDDAAWPRERDRFKRRSDAAGYALAGHLLRFYMQANVRRETSAKALVRAKDEIVAVGAPCVPPLIDLMILDRIPLREDTYFIPDDLTRQDCLEMLERIGSSAAPELLRVLKRKDLGIKARRFLALALGGTRDPRAYDPLVATLRGDPSWQVRADAATALASLGDPRAIEPLGQAVREDPDPAVVKRAGKAREELRSAGRR